MNNKQIILGAFLLVGSAVLLSGCLGAKKAEPVQPATPTPAAEEVLGEKQTALLDGQYVVDSEQTTVAWLGKKVLIESAHSGTLKVKSGSLTVQDGKLSGGEITMDMTTIVEDEKDSGVVKHLKTPDFFDVEKYPTAVLKITEATDLGNGQYNIKADLTIKNKTNPVEFTTALNSQDGALNAQAQLVIDRSLWDVRFGSGKFFENLGDKAIADEIAYTINLVAKVQ